MFKGSFLPLFFLGGKNTQKTFPVGTVLSVISEQKFAGKGTFCTNRRGPWSPRIWLAISLFFFFFFFNYAFYIEALVQRVGYEL